MRLCVLNLDCEFVRVCVCVGPVWWEAGCELSRTLAGLELSGQQEKSEQVGAKKAPFILVFVSLFLLYTFITIQVYSLRMYIVN